MGSRRIHTYAASFGDDLAKQLIEDNTQPGQITLDPFSGAATSLTQARLLGRSAVGIDVDPVACLIARVVTEKYSVEEINELVRFGRECGNGVGTQVKKVLRLDPKVMPGSCYSLDGYEPSVPDNHSIVYWFSPIQRAVLAVLMARAGATENEKVRAAICLAVSAAIIHKWPNTISLARDIDHSRPHRTEKEDISVESELKIFSRSAANVARILKRIRDSSAESECTYRVIEGDACEALQSLEGGSVQYVLTSPPYFDAIDYPRAHKFSEWWLSPDKKIVGASYIGLKPAGKVTKDATISLAKELVPECLPAILPVSEVSVPLFAKLVRYIVDLDKVTAGLGHALEAGGLVNVIIANNVIREVEIPVVEIIHQLLERNGFVEYSVIPRSIASNRRRYPYGIRGFRGLMNTEYIISAAKPE